MILLDDNDAVIGSFRNGSMRPPLENLASHRDRGWFDSAVLAGLALMMSQQL